MASRSPAAKHLWRVLGQNDAGGLRDILHQLDADDLSAIQPLVYALRTQAQVHDEIGDALTRYGAPAVTSLIKALKGDAPHWAAGVLVKFGGVAVPSLMAALRARNAQTRQWAADVLGRIADPQGLDLLRTAISDPSSNVRFHALHAIGRIRPTSQLPEILASAQSDPDWSARREAIMLVANQDPVRAAGLFAELAIDPVIGRFACVALRGLGVDGMPALHRLMIDGPEDGRMNAALALGWRDKQAVSILIGIVADKSASIQRRLEAGSALWLADEPKAMEVDRQILGDQSEDARLRALAARALQGARGADFDRALTEALDDASPAVRAGAVAGLSSGHDPNAVDKIVLKLADHDAYVRTSAGNALSRLADRRALNALVGALSDPEWPVRGAAVNALGSLRDPSAIPPIERLLVAETDRFVRDESLRVLHNLRLSQG